jgi:hypothetical protein
MRIILAAAIAAAFSLPAVALDVPKDGYVISHDLNELPEPVREKREALIAAARTGDIEALRPIFAAQETPPNVSFGDPEDPIEHLKRESGDGEGIDTLAILKKTLEAPYAAMDGGDGTIYYVWPYFAAMDDLRTLTPEQLVDGYALLGWRGFEDQREVGGWIHWRAFIDADGALSAFVAGD